MTNINHGLDVVRAIVQRYKDNVVVVGIEPLNEPWWNTPLPWLKHYYWRSYQIVQNEVPHWITLLHDSFRFYLQNWGSFMVNCPNWALDVHLYQAWSPPMDGFSYQSYACEDGNRIREMEAAGVPVVVGEWSLSTDSCALWIGGFQDNGPGRSLPSPPLPPTHRPFALHQHRNKPSCFTPHRTNLLPTIIR